MADTTVRPRPAFSTFLKSDAEDSLAFYQQKAFLRRTKTVSLQQKREENEALKVKALEEYRLLQHGGGYRARHLTEPSVTLKERKSKSANLHRHVAWQTNCEQESSIREDIDRNRPKTAGDPTPGNKQSWSETKQGLRDGRRDGGDQVVELPIEENVAPHTSAPPPHRRAFTEPVPTTLQQNGDPMAIYPDQLCNEFGGEVDSMKAAVDELALRFSYTSTTKKCYDEVGWSNKLPAPPPFPVTTHESKPDLVTVRLNIKRLEDGPQAWQSEGRKWDSLQSREGKYPRGPGTIHYCSTSQSTQQIPGYTGWISCGDQFDNPQDAGRNNHIIRHDQPRHVAIARRANIPGYTGSAHWSSVAPANSKTTPPFETTSSRIHRRALSYEGKSPFIRSSPFSKTISLTRPYNPFNQIEAK